MCLGRLGDGGCGFDWVGRVVELDVLRERGFEVLERFRRTLRGQTVGAIEEAEARAVVKVRAEN